MKGSGILKYGANTNRPKKNISFSNLSETSDNNNSIQTKTSDGSSLKSPSKNILSTVDWNKKLVNLLGRSKNQDFKTTPEDQRIHDILLNNQKTVRKKALYQQYLRTLPHIKMKTINYSAANKVLNNLNNTTQQNDTGDVLPPHFK